MSDKISYANAPYNFIPFPKKFFSKYESIDNIPKHNKRENYTGSIKYTIKLKTPLVLTKNSNDLEFYNINDKYCIPASTIRGKLRTNCEILSNSFPEFIEDNKYSFREVAARAQSSLTKEYKKIISTNDEKKINDIVSVGIIKFYGGKYTIFPLKRIKNENGRELNFLFVKDKNLKNTELEKYSLDRRSYRPYFEKLSFDEKNDVKVNTRQMYKFKIDNNGNYYLMNSNNMRGKKNHYLMNAKINNLLAPIEIPSDLIVEYKTRLDSMQNKNHKSEYYELPKEREEKPVFYIEDKNGKLIAFGFTPYLRIPYKNSTMSFLNKQRDELKIDYASALFGFTNENYAYKGRVEFDNAYLIDEESNNRIIVKTEEKEKENKLEYIYKKLDYENIIYKSLLAPKPTSIQLYLEQVSNEISKLIHYNTDNFELRGRKFYWLKDKADLKDEGEKNYRARIMPLKKGYVFEGKINFKNLTKDELGLLLASIKPFEHPSIDFFDNLGQAKPYGFGRVEFNISDLEFTDSDIKEKYSLENLDLSKDDILFRKKNVKKNTKKEVISEFKKAYFDYFHKNAKFYENEREIIMGAFRYSKMLSDSEKDEKFEYMDLKKFKERAILKNLKTILEDKNKIFISPNLKFKSERENIKTDIDEIRNQTLILVISKDRTDETFMKVSLTNFDRVKYIMSNEYDDEKYKVYDIVIINNLNGRKDSVDYKSIEKIIKHKNQGYLYFNSQRQNLEYNNNNIKLINYANSHVTLESYKV